MSPRHASGAGPDPRPSTVKSGHASGNRLLVLITDSLSDIIRKGEVTSRYYNPGNVFGEVHIAMMNDDRPDPRLVRKMVGDAVLVLHNFPVDGRLYLRTLGWRPFLLARWARPIVDLARKISPDLVRCHTNHLNAFAAAAIRKELGIPYVVSLHTSPDDHPAGVARPLRRRIVTRTMERVERLSLARADLVLPVYRPIQTYLERMGVSRSEVAYNVLNPDNLRRKEDYRLRGPARIVCVSRQMPGKNPINLIRAVAAIPGARLTLVGEGALHDGLRSATEGLGCGDRISFEPSLANDRLCALLPEFDIFAAHSEYCEISKSVLEPLLTGLPVILNRRRGRPVPELEGDFLMLVDDSPEGYGAALRTLIENHARREALGRAAYEHANRHWSPARTEERYATLYRQLLGTRLGGSPIGVDADIRREETARTRGGRAVR